MLVNEPGFYELVFKSRLPSARIFRQWVYARVIPSIRKYGYYKMIDSRIKQRVIFDGEKYYKHLVFSNYAAIFILIRLDNRIKNLQLLTPKQNSGKNNNRPIISINIENKKEIKFISINEAAVQLNIDSSFISKICRKKG